MKNVFISQFIYLIDSTQGENKSTLFLIFLFMFMFAIKSEAVPFPLGVSLTPQGVLSDIGLVPGKKQIDLVEVRCFFSWAVSFVEKYLYLEMK